MNDLEIKEATERGIKVYPEEHPARSGSRRQLMAGRRRGSRPRQIGLWGCPVHAWRSAA